jgi:hypothetical protein
MEKSVPLVQLTCPAASAARYKHHSITKTGEKQ